MSELEGEAEKVKQVREIVANIDWDCEVKTLYRDKNFRPPRKNKF